MKIGEHRIVAKITLGLSGAVGHDPAAAIFVGNELIAAVEEERLIRKKHAKEEWPILAARQVMQIAGVRSVDIDHVAIPYAPISLFSKARWHYAYRHWYAPDRSVDSLINGNRRYNRYHKELGDLLEKLHIPKATTKVVPVRHQLAHASSVYHLNETDQKTAILCLDSKGEYSNVFIGYGFQGEIVRLKEFYNPDSLCGMYAALTDYLGFEILDGEFKVMGMAPYGDPNKYDLSSLASFDGRKFKVNNTLISTVGLRRYKAKLKGHYFSKKLVNMLGPRREGNLTDDPYVHYAAAIQQLYEDMTIQIMESYLSDILKQSGRLAIAGTGAMNIRLNKRLAEHPLVKELIVHPACGDAGTAIGAAAYVARKNSGKLAPLKNVSLGPTFNNKLCIEACQRNRERPNWKELEDPFAEAAELLANGKVVAWMRGRMEFGPRALGNRSIFANPTEPDIVKSINKRVKFREHWRPFSTSVLDSMSAEFFEKSYDDKYMCISQQVKEPWRSEYPFITSNDGTGRSQCVNAQNNSDLYKLLTHFQEKSGHGVLMNTALSRPGEALVCSPDDALNMFMGTDLEYLIMQDILVTKREETSNW
jgi:carbamoyltransferase|tara:strand:+ start:2514 stop:4286 length:1773 start_codon:yes stop_codon:yes gene_type:complete